MHCDTVTRCYDEGRSICNGSQEVSLEKAHGFDHWIQIFAIFIKDGLSCPFDTYKKYVEFFKSEIRNNHAKMTQCTVSGDVDDALAVKKCAAILAVENAAVLVGNLDHIARLAADGVKVITLTWNGENELGYGSPVGGHLKSFGKKAVAEMEQNGIHIDVSHLSDDGFADVMALCGSRVLATHSNLRSVCGHARNLTDAQFQALVERGGIIGLNLHKPFLNETEGFANTSDALFLHVDKMLKLGGQNNIAFGCDFDGAKMPRFCKDISDIPALYDQFKMRYGVQITENIFFKNAKAYFDRNLT